MPKIISERCLVRSVILTKCTEHVVPSNEELLYHFQQLLDSEKIDKLPSEEELKTCYADKRNVNVLFGKRIICGVKHLLPSTEILCKLFNNLYYRNPTDLELSQIKVDILGENVIFLFNEQENKKVS
jgi:hypothetical protein